MEGRNAVAFNGHPPDPEESNTILILVHSLDANKKSFAPSRKRILSLEVP